MGRTALACSTCLLWMKVRRNGVNVLETLEDGTTPYKVWEADLWECPECSHQVLSGFGLHAISEKHKDHFAEHLARVNITIRGCPRSLTEKRTMKALARRQPDGAWEVTVDGTVVLSDETYQVASNVAYELEHPNVCGPSECAEVADRIRCRLERA